MLSYALGRRHGARTKLNRCSPNQTNKFEQKRRTVQRGTSPDQDGFHAVDLGDLGLGGYDGYEIPDSLPPQPPPPPPPGARPSIMSTRM